MAVGSGYPGYSNSNKKVEAQQRNGVWQTLDDFPFVADWIYGYSMVNFNDELYIFGMVLFNLKLAILNSPFFLINSVFKAVTAMIMMS